MIRILKVGALYFAAVFGFGFLLGVIRTLWVVPRLGNRVAELIEAPIMLLVVFLAAGRIVRWHPELPVWKDWLTAGMLALAFLLAVEFTVVLWLRDLSFAQYFATRDPVSSTVYVALLGAFAVMPFLVFRHRRRTERPDTGGTN